MRDHGTHDGGRGLKEFCIRLIPNQAGKNVDNSTGEKEELVIPSPLDCGHENRIQYLLVEVVTEYRLVYMVKPSSDLTPQRPTMA